MSSKSNTTDATSPVTTTHILDRKAVQGQGQQILDSVIIDPSDEVSIAAMRALQAGFLDTTERNAGTVKSFLDMALDLLNLADRGQVQIAETGYRALTNARDNLETLENQGKFVIEFASDVSDASFDMVNRVAEFQAEAQREALQIVSDAKTGDFSASLKTLSGMVMIFALGAIYLARKS